MEGGESSRLALTKWVLDNPRHYQWTLPFIITKAISLVEIHVTNFCIQEVGVCLSFECCVWDDNNALLKTRFNGDCRRYAWKFSTRVFIHDFTSCDRILYQAMTMSMRKSGKAVIIVHAQGYNDVISSYHIYPSCFSTILWGKMFVILTSLS